MISIINQFMNIILWSCSSFREFIRRTLCNICLTLKRIKQFYLYKLFYLLFNKIYREEK